MRIDEMINTPCRELKKLSETERWNIAREVAKYYQNEGFPYFTLSQKKKEEIAIKLWEYKVENLELPDNELQQNMLGLTLANFYHPQMWSVQCGKSDTPLQVFWDIDKLTRAIYKRINNSDTKLQPFNIRKAIQVFGGYRVSNFKPTIAKYIYENYCPPNGAVLDPCAGYGGRLLGAISSSNVYTYVGIDPDERQIEGNGEMGNDVLPAIPKENMDIHLMAIPFEGCAFSTTFDLVFTSPPYFNLEKYSTEDTQSYVRYPTYDEWKDGFLFTLISNSFCALKSGGVFAINVAGENIINDTLSYSTHLFRSKPEIKKMRLSRVLGHGNTGTFKLENIYIWRKH